MHYFISLPYTEWANKPVKEAWWEKQELSLPLRNPLSSSTEMGKYNQTRADKIISTGVLGID